MRLSNQWIGSFPFSSNILLFVTEWNRNVLSKIEEMDPSGAFAMNKYWESAHMPFQFLLSGSIHIISE